MLMKMGLRTGHILLWLVLAWPSASEDISALDPELHGEDRWLQRNYNKPDHNGEPCSHLRFNAKDIVKRFYAIVPYLDKDHSNTAFLHKFRGTVYAMSQGEDLLDREAAYYGTVLTPVIFLQQYKDTWCLLERFHRALRLYQISHPTEKRSALKLLQNLRAVSHKVHSFILDLPGSSTARHTTEAMDGEDEEFKDKKDIRYLKELIKNLGRKYSNDFLFDTVMEITPPTGVRRCPNW